MRDFYHVHFATPRHLLVMICIQITHFIFLVSRPLQTYCGYFSLKSLQLVINLLTAETGTECHIEPVSGCQPSIAKSYYLIFLKFVMFKELLGM